MQVLAHGIDLVEVTQFSQRIKLYDDEDLLSELFTKTELLIAGAGVRRIQHLAGRFAAKEAVLKALGTGWVDGISWTDVEITQNGSGAPIVALHSECAKIAAENGVVQWLLSISHTENIAIASAICLGVPVPQRKPKEPKVPS